MSATDFTLRFQIGTDPAEGGSPAPRPSAAIDGELLIERDRTVTLSDGVAIHTDVFRPAHGDPVPALIAWGPYGKHNGGAVYGQFANEAGERGGGVEPGWISAYTTFEGPDPRRWCANGYAVINVDPRGTWWSGGEYATVWDEREARDCGDVIAWAAAEPWCTGKVGMSGVSYLAVAQWWAASLRPPALAAINPCEGLSDVYREFAFHGGIPVNFPRFWQENRLRYSQAKIEAVADMMDAHPLDDAYWDSKRPDLSQIEIPAYVIASWSDHGLHTRGTLAAFEALGSERKYLEVHGRKKWESYHRPSSVERQRQFFDRFLKDIDNEVEDWSPVRMEIRRRYYEGEERTAARWPPPDLEPLRLYLDAELATLDQAAPHEPAEAAYASEEGSLHFRHVFADATDVVGGARLRVWAHAAEADDMDLFAALRKRDRDGAVVDFPYANVLEHGPTALGWLRISHRGLDEARSTTLRPWHDHAEEARVKPGEVVVAEIEVWPSATRFEAGEALELLIGGHDHYGGAPLYRHDHARNRGTHVVHAGGRFDSSLTLGVLPR